MNRTELSEMWGRRCFSGKTMTNERVNRKNDREITDADRRQNAARRKVEDIKLAQEMGVRVEDLY